MAKVLMLAALLGMGSAFATNCTVTYVWPVAGATAPTAAQARRHNMVVADVAYLAGDASCAITHNLALPNATGASGRPKVTVTATAVGSAAVVPFIAFTDANTLTMDKNSTASNTSITVRVWIERPAAVTQ